MIFFDSDAIIAFLREKPSMAAFITEHKNENFAIPTPVLFEIYYGFYYPPKSKRFKNDKSFLLKIKDEEAQLIQFLRDIEVFDLNLPAIMKAAEISAGLDAIGRPCGKIDALIAGIVLSAGGTQIVTNNTKHYENIAELSILNF